MSHSCMQGILFEAYVLCQLFHDFKELLPKYNAASCHSYLLMQIKKKQLWRDLFIR